VFKELSRLNINAFGLGLPALLGVVVGVRLYTGGLQWLLGAALVFGVFWVLLGVGRLMVISHPRTGAWIIEVWIVSAVLVTAFMTDLILWLTLMDWFPSVLGEPTGKPLEKLSATLVGAVATFTALVWTKDIADAKGYFWPSTQFRYGLEALYKKLAVKPKPNTIPSNAIYMDVVADTDITGWSFADRRARAKIIAAYMKNPS
jgi:hypothetical protein